MLPLPGARGGNALESDPPPSSTGPAAGEALTEPLGTADVDLAAPGVWLYLVLAGVALLLNLAFAMSQTAVAAIGAHARVGTERDEPPFPKRLQRLIRHLPALEQQFAIASILMLAIMGMALVSALAGWLPGAGLGAVFAGAALAVVLQFLVVELFGRHLALTAPLGFSLWLVPAARWLALPVVPLRALGGAFGSYFTEGAPPGHLTDMHLRLLPNLSGIERVLDEDAFDMIDSVREFAEATAEEIMTPRTEVEGIPEGLPPAEVYERLRKSEYSRLVVYRGTMDEVTGTLLAKEVLLQRPKDPYSLLRRPVMVNEGMTLPELLSEIRRHRTHLVVVLDEYGGMSGIVTLHDLFEMIVGHIEDVEDEEEDWIEKVEEGVYRLDGRVELWELNEELGLALDEDAARTAGGFIFNTLGRVPKPGEEVPGPGCVFRVAEMDKARVVTVELRLRAPGETFPDGEEPG